MSIYSRLKDLLGTFWGSVFKSTELIDSIIATHSLLLKHSDAEYRRWAGGLVAADDELYVDKFPFTIYIPRKDEKDASSLADVLAGTAVLGDDGGLVEYTIGSLYEIPRPAYITDHIIDYRVTLFDCADFDFDDGRFTFYMDLDKLGLPVVRMLDSDGMPREYYKLFGWTEARTSFKDMVSAFEDPILEPFAKDVWKMHQEGATLLNIKRLLASVTGSTMVENDCTVTRIWSEQGSVCITDSNNNVYVLGTDVFATSDSSPDDEALVEAGILVRLDEYLKAGDLITGDIKVISGADLSEEQLDGSIEKMEVQTEVGTLTAYNKVMDCAVVSGVNILPLEGEKSEEYYRQCAKLATDPAKEKIEVPERVNPMYFIMHNIRGDFQLIIFIAGKRTSVVDAAIECIRRNMIASSRLDVFYV